jgi:hypothetical protein
MPDEKTQSTPQEEMQDGTVTDESARTGASTMGDSGEAAQKTEAAQDANAGTAGSGERDEEAIAQQMRELEENPPDKLEDWPDGPAKYETFGGPEGDHSYEEGPERKLGPSSLRRHPDGSVEIEGEKVDNPDDYKREPLENPMSQSAGDD